jgi:NCAIR mutase (PurE)-related protein
MSVIKRIDLDFINEFIKNIVGVSSQIKLFQEELEDVILQMRENKNYFSTGKISKEIYERNKIILEKEKEKLSSRIDEEIERGLKIIKEAKLVFEENRI